MKDLNFVEVMKKPKKFEKKLRFVVISDTHSKHDALLPILENFKADYLLHCGDFTNWNHWFKKKTIPESVEKFNEFLGKLKGIKKVLVVAGNHDEGARTHPLQLKKNGWSGDDEMKKEIQKHLSNAKFLSDEEYLIEKIKVYAASYNVKHLKNEYLVEQWKKIPEDTNILLTHFPPNFAGNKSLLRRIRKLQELKVHAFGHFHARYKVEKGKRTTFMLASSFHKKDIHKPICFDYYI